METQVDASTFLILHDIGVLSDTHGFIIAKRKERKEGERKKRRRREREKDPGGQTGWGHREKEKKSQQGMEKLKKDDGQC